MRLAALVPMRHTSERVPGKNYRPMAGKPLYTYIIQSLLACDEIDLIVVDTDSPIIMQGLRDAFPAVKVIERPQALRDGMISMNEIIRHDIEQVEADCYLQTHSTNPLLTTETIHRAVSAFFAARPSKDSLFSVTRVQTRLWSQDGEPINHNPEALIRTQDLPPVYEENSCLYMFPRQTFLEQNNRLGKHPLMFEIDRREALDIDEELDFAIAEDLILRRSQKL
jgi:CMP-N-acetylneuraminic acid synthetase